jgi:hypothetical protein
LADFSASIPQLLEGEPRQRIDWGDTDRSAAGEAVIKLRFSRVASSQVRREGHLARGIAFYIRPTMSKGAAMVRFRVGALAALSAIVFLTADGTAGPQSEPKPTSRYKVIRFKSNPIIHSGLKGLEGWIGQNINGPSLIRVPGWIDNPLGKYYLYFAHHGGAYIRLAFADRLEGPWTVHSPGVLHLQDAPGRGHIASPDVHVDESAREIRMYFHQPPSSESLAKEQQTYLALSKDGLRFAARKEELGHAYLRAFPFMGKTYAFGMAGTVDGVFMRSADGRSPFEDGPHCLPKVRHSALWVEGKTLFVLYTIVGEAPERILLSTVDLSKDWKEWSPSPPEILLEPETDYEGASLPLIPSRNGAVPGPVRQLRDPAIFQEDGKRYLLYAVAGEQGIAIGEIVAREKK